MLITTEEEQKLSNGPLYLISCSYPLTVDHHRAGLKPSPKFSIRGLTESAPLLTTRETVGRA